MGVAHITPIRRTREPHELKRARAPTPKPVSGHGIERRLPVRVATVATQRAKPTDGLLVKRCRARLLELVPSVCEPPRGAEREGAEHSRRQGASKEQTGPFGTDAEQARR